MRTWILAISLFLASCGSVDQSSLQGLGADGAGNNQALLIGAPNNLPGVPTDITELTKMFQNDVYDFHFNVTAKNKATVADILAATKVAAKDADSLFWYFSGHGGDGILLAQGSQTFTFKQVADAIKSVRTTPLKRLVVLLDSCESGSFVDGTSAIVTENGSETGPDKVLSANRDGSLYEQAFIMSASTKDENAQDDGVANGGAFTYSMRRVFKTLYDTDHTATFRKWALETSKLTEEDYGHTPMYRGYPVDKVMDDMLFVYRAK